jgi:acetyl esterase/lipase
MMRRVELDLFAAMTVLPPPSGARVVRDLAYHTSADGPLLLDAYRPARPPGPRPGVLLVNGDADEATIARAKDWGVYRSYGEHLAARGLVGIPFNHRSTARGKRYAEVAQQIGAAIAYVRTRADELEVDADRLGVWAFSGAGPFAVAPLLRSRPQYVKALVGFYTIWDLSPYAEIEDPPSRETIDQWSVTNALRDSVHGLPPVLLARAGRDGPRVLDGTDRFIARARALGADLEVLDHPTGRHGFDILDADDTSRSIITSALAFLERRLS